MSKTTQYLFALLLALAPALGHAMTMYPLTGTLRITGVFVRDEPPLFAGGSGFYIQMDAQIPISQHCTAYSPSQYTIYLLIPRKVPGPNNTIVDNPMYNRLYDNAIVAYVTQKPVNVWVEGCVVSQNTWPRVWGIDLIP